MTKGEFKTEIESIARLDDTEREYEKRLTDLARSGCSSKDMEELLKHYLQDNRAKMKAYTVFYCLHIYHRNLLNILNLEQLWTDYNEKFKGMLSYDHLDLCRFQMIASKASYEEQKEYLKKAYEDSKKGYPNKAGYLHMFSSLYINVLEAHEDDPIYKEVQKKWGTLALKAVEDAIRNDEAFALFYCTKGRILSSRGEFEEADKAFCEAIAKANSGDANYAIQIESYQYHRLQSQLRKQRCLINQEQSTINDIKRNITSNIEIIALFSGIISFVIGSLRLAEEETTAHAALLIIVLMGCLTAVYSIFTLLLHASDTTYKKLPAILVAAISLVVVILLVALLWVYSIHNRQI